MVCFLSSDLNISSVYSVVKVSSNIPCSWQDTVSNIRRTFVTFQWVALARPMMIACHLYCVRLGVGLSSSSGGHRDPRVTLVQRGYLIGPLIVCLLHCLSAITPFFGQKRSPGGGQNCFWAIFVNRPIKPLGKIFQTQKNRFKKSFFFSELQEHEVRICVQPNFPIIILILLNGFHKFAMSMGPNTNI